MAKKRRPKVEVRQERWPFSVDDGWFYYRNIDQSVDKMLKILEGGFAIVRKDDSGGWLLRITKFDLSLLKQSVHDSPRALKQAVKLWKN